LYDTSGGVLNLYKFHKEIIVAKIPNPTKWLSPFEDRVRVELYGQGYDTDWRPSLETWEKVSLIGERAGVSSVFVPNLAFGRSIYCPSQFGGHPLLFGARDCSVLSGPKADGVILFPGQACWLSSADCPTVLLKNMRTGVTIVLHAGRRCLVDEENIFNGTTCSPSIIDAAIKLFADTDRDKLRVFLFLGIGAKHFLHSPAHPTWGSRNSKLNEFILNKWGKRCFWGSSDSEIGEGRISLFDIIVAQCMEHGIREDHCSFGLSETFSDTYPENGEKPLLWTPFMWYSHRRAVFDGGEDLEARNGIFVLNKR